MPKTPSVREPESRTQPVKVSPWFHALAKQIANATREEIGAVIERLAGDALVAENDRVQAELKTRIPARRA